jgi:hypothetical protein
MNRVYSGDQKFDRRTCLKGVVGMTAGFLASDRFAVARPDAGDVPQQASPVAPLTLEQSLRLAGQNLLGILNPEDNYLPYWALDVTPDYKASLGRWWPAHNLPRLAL